MDSFMKYNAYIVEFKHRDTGFTGSIVHDDTISPANFRKIGKDLFIANFKNQLEFHFLQDLALKNKSKKVTVLIPVLAKYNKRKLTKISKYLGVDDFKTKDKKDILLNYLSVEKFVRVRDLLDFFSIPSGEMIDFLMEKEIREEIKLIDLIHLTVAAYQTVMRFREELNTIFADCYTSRSKSVKLADIEAMIKLPQSSLLFKYLVRSLKKEYSFRFRKERIVFRIVALSDSEKNSLTEVENILKKNKLSVFTVEDVVKSSTELIYNDVNDALWFMVDNGQVVQLNEKYFIFSDDLNKILNKLKKYKRNQGDLIDIQAFRELTMYTRKYIIPLFEYFDANKITERVENQRKILLGA
jgi:hypothetical protein